MSTRLASDAARDLLADVRRIDVGKSSVGDLAILEYKYHRYLNPGGSCKGLDCSVSFGFSNAWFSRVRLAPYTALGIGIHTAQNSVRSVNVVAECYTNRGGAPIVVQVLQRVSSKLNPSPSSGAGKEQDGVIFAFSLDLTPSSSSSQLDQAYAFNTNFLYRLRGCHDARDILPTINQNATR
jgi:hypothetical protein